MACYHPLYRIEIPNTYIQTKKGKITNKAFILGEHEFMNKYKEKINPNYYIKVPCGKCIGCRIDYSRQWANRIYLEAKKYKENQCWFLTLTYNNENLPTKTVKNEKTGEIKTGMTLNKKELSDFMKKLRRHYEYHYNHTGIRFYGAGEYGEKNGRPHYHICLFNMPIFTKLKEYKTNELGQMIWLNEEIEKIWGKGFITLGRICWETAAYTARYMLKKQKGPNAEWWYKSQAKEPEFTIMSRKPGIAREYYEKNKSKIYENDEVPILRGSKAIMVRPPAYYDSLYDIENHDEMEEIKLNRRIRAEQAERNKLSRTSKTEQEVRLIEENKKIQQIKKCVREL